MPSPPPRNPSPTPRGPSSTPPVGKAGGFRAVAGPACPVGAAQRTRVSSGWQVVPGDSWTGDGCGDRFLYSPPGDPNYLQWLFTFEAAAARTCRIEVFVPDSPLASARVWYGVADRFENVDYRVGGFTVDQRAGRGRWVKAATVAVGTGVLLVNVDGDQGTAGVTGGPLRVTCAGSAR
jgi:hypothetical protein